MGCKSLEGQKDKFWQKDIRSRRIEGRIGSQPETRRIGKVFSLAVNKINIVNIVC